MADYDDGEPVSDWDALPPPEPPVRRSGIPWAARYQKGRSKYEEWKATYGSEGGIKGLVATIIFWILVLILAPSTLLTATYLLVFLAILSAVVEKAGKEPLGLLLFNNNWVVFAALSMIPFTAIAWWWNPYTTSVEDLLPWWARGAIGTIAGMLGHETAPRGQSTFGGFWNKLWFGEYNTQGWMWSTLFYVVATIGGFAVSFWDNFLRGIGRFFLGLDPTDITAHAVGLGIFHKLFGGGSGKKKKKGGGH